jgi:hypothetical protein
MLELLKRMLTGENAFASGGLLLMIIGGVSVWLRAVPENPVLDRKASDHDDHRQ